MQPNSKWKLLEAIATNNAASDTLGLSVLKIEPAPFASSSAIPDTELFQCTGDADCFKALTPHLKKTIQSHFKTTEIYVLNLANGWALVGQPDEQPTFLPGLPVFLYSPQSDKLQPLKALDKQGFYQITLSASREWLSIKANGSAQLKIYRFDQSDPIKTLEEVVTRELWLGK